MKKFDKISINNYKENLIQNIELNDLGTINVLCGKNNSGKSTILSALNELSKRNVPSINEIGSDPDYSFYIDTKRTNFSADEFDLNEIGEVDFVFEFEYSNSKVEIENYTREFIFGKLKEFLDQNKIRSSFSDQSQFEANFIYFLAETGVYEIDPKYMTHFLPTSTVREFSKQVFPSRQSVKLIQNERSLPSRCKIIDYEESKIRGERILNFILFCKEQLPDSASFKKYTSLQGVFTEISNGYKFGIAIEDKLELNLFFTNSRGEWVNADSSGLGLRDLLAILSHIILLDFDIYLIEEPERHLHSSIQRNLLIYLSRQNKQFFIATHSNVFLDLDYVDTIFITEYNHGQIKATNESSKARALMELGYSVADNIVSDLVILTEGPSDRAIIEHFLYELGALKSKIVKFWPLGGDIMDKHDLSVLKDSYHVIALVDNDPGSSVIRTRFAVKCIELGIKCHRLQRYSIENYITLEALKRQFSTQIRSSLTSIDPNIKLEDQIGLNVKNTLNRVVKHMTFSDIKGTDLGDFILEVNKLLAQNSSTLKT